MIAFGTDGVRGVANRDLTPEVVLAVGRAAARVLGGDQFVVGRDTRLSGPMLQAALSAGVAAEGLSVIDLGVVPTPAVAHSCATLGCAGAVMSASHNPFVDNGVKLFAAGGRKLSDDLEAALEAEYGRPATEDDAGPTGDAVGAVVGGSDAVAAYRNHLLDDVIGGRRLDGLRIALDCGNGAASALGPEVLGALGADVTVLHAAPDGTNINARCGSTDLGDVRAAVTDLGLDLGLALDGDADRVLGVDARGSTVDGDHILAMLALDFAAAETLAERTVVVTVMANLGLHRAMDAHGIAVVETPVGDRNVLDAMDAGGFTLGGEQSGHVIVGPLGRTGDGMQTGILVADLVARTGRPVADLAGVVTKFPQVLENVPVDRAGADVVAAVATDIEALAADLGRDGRVLVRPSGTEPVVRVMVEAPTAARAADAAVRLAEAVRRAGAAVD